MPKSLGFLDYGILDLGSGIWDHPGSGVMVGQGFQTLYRQLPIIRPMAALLVVIVVIVVIVVMIVTTVIVVIVVVEVVM